MGSRDDVGGDGVTVLSKLAWVIAGVSAVVVIVDTVVVAVSTGLLTEASIGIHGWPFVNCAALGSCVLGAIVVSNYPRHPIGWLLSLVGVTSAVSLLAESYSLWVVDHDGPGSNLMGEYGGMLAAFLGGPLALAALTIVFLLVPDGSFLSRRWRFVATAAVAGYIACVLGILVIGPHGTTRREGIDAPLAAEILSSGGILLIAAMLVAAIVGMVIRLRRSSGDTRQQLRLVAYGATAVGFALVWLLVGQISAGGQQTWWSSIPLFAAYAVLVVCVALAVLRYRLYDVDLIVSRAVVLTIATAFVAVSYVAIVVWSA